MNALRVETCMLYMYFKETSLISHASLESSNKESINQKYIDGLVQDCNNSMGNALKLLQFCTKPSTWWQGVSEWLSLTAFLGQQTARSKMARR